MWLFSTISLPRTLAHIGQKKTEYCTAQLTRRAYTTFYIVTGRDSWVLGSSFLLYSLPSLSPSLHSHPHCSFATTEMLSVGVSYISLLNAVAYHCGVSFVSYLWELGNDGTLLAGVELLLPCAGFPGNAECRFFCVVASEPYDMSHEIAASEALRFLQSKYGFVVQDYTTRLWSHIEGWL